MGQVNSLFLTIGYSVFDYRLFYQIGYSQNQIGYSQIQIGYSQKHSLTIV